MPTFKAGSAGGLRSSGLGLDPTGRGGEAATDRGCCRGEAAGKSRRARLAGEPTLLTGSVSLRGGGCVFLVEEAERRSSGTGDSLSGPRGLLVGTARTAPPTAVGAACLLVSGSLTGEGDQRRSGLPMGRWPGSPLTFMLSRNRSTKPLCDRGGGSARCGVRRAWSMGRVRGGVGREQPSSPTTLSLRKLFRRGPADSLHVSPRSGRGGRSSGSTRWLAVYAVYAVRTVSLPQLHTSAALYARALFTQTKPKQVRRALHSTTRAPPGANYIVEKFTCWL